MTLRALCQATPSATTTNDLLRNWRHYYAIPVVPNRYKSIILKAASTSIDEALIGIFAGINVMLDCEIITERPPIRSI